ncbi:MAG: hypothetical protein AAF573_01460 [Bacteroidota bacterium]
MRNIQQIPFYVAIIVLTFLGVGCEQEDDTPPTPSESGWVRYEQNPILRDVYPGGAYESASDGHVFYDDEGRLKMIYSGDHEDRSSIKLASGNSLTDWSVTKPLLFEPNTLNLDINKETAFYRKAKNGKHQIFYIGYPDGTTYQSQIFLAEADSLEGPYTQIANPVVPRGEIAGKDVYLITSPSVVEHEDLLYMVFLGWNDDPQNVSNVWVIGATSGDDGYTWSNFQEVETPIGMEGQVTQAPDGSFVAVRTGEDLGMEALYYATSNHPFGPWDNDPDPILVEDGSILEKDEVIAPQITFDPQTGEAYLFYTGADHLTGWWMMLARKE